MIRPPPTSTPFPYPTLFRSLQTDMHHFVGELGRGPVLRKKHDLPPLTLRPFENFYTPAPGCFLAIVDLPQVQPLPLHHSARRTAPALHDAPVAMLLAVLDPARAAKKHTAIIHGPPYQARGKVFTTTPCAETPPDS